MLGLGSAQPSAPAVAVVDLPARHPTLHSCKALHQRDQQRGVLWRASCFGREIHTPDKWRTSRRFGLMVNSTLVSVMLLSSLTLMLLVLPVVLPPLPPPPPFLMLVPVVIFILLLLIAFVPSEFIVVTYV